MLMVAGSLKELNFTSLMQVYAQGNLENAEELWQDEPEGVRLLLAEQAFYQYLRDGFFTAPGAVYAIWTLDGEYVSALRLEPYQDGLLLEALETAPEHRRKGYAKMLIHAVLERFSGRMIYSHVGKRNTASMATHESCGFRKVLDHAVYVDGSVSWHCWTYVIDS